MSKTIKFTKMQGTGNDFVVIDDRQSELEGVSLDKLAMKVCDRHFGVGADGLIIVMPSKKADFRMRIFNPDGSEAEMCGNGIRCFAKFVYDSSKDKKDVFSVETLAGIMVPAVIVKGGLAVGAEVDMGEPRPGDIDQEFKVSGQSYKITTVSMGNPHCVIFVDNIDNIDISGIGPKIENDKKFPNRTNVEFVQVQSDKEISLKVWERGAGITLACGTGACASVVAAVLNKRTGRRVLVHLPGGDLDIEWELEDSHVAMRGPAEKVFEGELELR